MSENTLRVEGDDIHLRWMREAMDMVRTYPIIGSGSELRITQAEEAMAAKEVPVGCVFVRDNKITARARNRTNELRNVYPSSLRPSTQILNARTFEPGHETRRAGSNRRDPLRPIPYPAR